MEITINIPDDELMELVKEKVSENIARRMLETAYGDGYFYRREIKAAIREVIRSDIDNLSERAVAAASKSIENRAVKKLLDKLEDK